MGLVVDDAIVMTENIYVRIEKGMPPKEAGIEGAKEIFFAVISTTITLVAVFFPIVFMDGKRIWVGDIACIESEIFERYEL